MTKPPSAGAANNSAHAASGNPPGLGPTSPSASELAICNDEELIVLDEELSALFADIRISVANTNRVRTFAKSHEQWLRERNQCAQDFQCLRESYRNRIKEITPDRSL